MRAIAILLAAAAAAPAASLRYWIEPCTRPETACLSGDPQLAEWAMEAWQAASAGRLTLLKTADPEQADLRFHWAGAREGLYGEARGSDIYVRPAVVPPGETDALLRDVVVFLSCVHESGHALGLPHTSDFADIMYSFQYGGDLQEYFARYRRLLKSRGDIRKHDGMSPQDRTRLRALFQ
jgi:hypothetical protein